MLVHGLLQIRAGMDRRLTLSLLLVLLAATAAGLWVGLSSDGGGEDAGPDAAATVGAADAFGRGGDLEIPVDTGRFLTLNGDSASMSDYAGRAVVLNLWGTWCPPCRREIPHLVDLQEEIEPRGGTVLGVAVQSGSPEQIRAFLDRYEADYPIWMASTRAVVERFQATGFPTTYIVDGEGVIRRRFLGPHTEAELLAAVEPYLPEG